MRTVRLAYIGCGGMAGAHCSGLKELYSKGYQDFRVVACCDTVLDRAESMAERFEEFQGTRPAVFADFHALLEKERDLDGVGVYTPHDCHHNIAIDFMSVGINVSTEKPFGFTMRAAAKMMDVAQQSGVVLQIAENYRMSPSERAANWVIRTGRIGTPRLLTWMDIGERKWYWQWRDHKEVAAGGWTLDGGVHFADLWLYHIGDIGRVSAVSATYDPIRYIEYKTREDMEKSLKESTPRYRKTRSLKDIDRETLREPVESNLEDTTAATLEFANGVVGVWVVSRAAPGLTDRSGILHGSEGALSWNQGLFGSTGELAIAWNDLVKEYMDSLPADEKDRLFPLGIVNTVAIEDKQFIDAILGRGEVEVDAVMGYKAMAIPMSVYESAAIGAPVSVQDVMDLKIEKYQGELNKIIGLWAG